VLPLFLFMGQMAFSAGLSRHAFEAGEKWLGRIPGGLAAATVFGCAIFATICGSSVATASTMARVALPEMLRQNYMPRLAAGCIAAGGTLGVLIPPSGILVVYSIVTQVSLVDLFIAAFVPGILTAVVYVVGIYAWVKINPTLAPRDDARVTPTWGERFASLGRAWELLILFAAVMGMIYLGIATPTEAAAMGAFFLGRQSWLAGFLLQFGEIGVGVATKAGAQDACLASLVEALAEFFPSPPIGSAEISAAWRALSGGHGGDQPCLSAQHGGRRGRSAAGGTPLVVALRAEGVLEIIVGARQARDGVAVEQPSAVAAADPAEVADGTAQATGAVAVAGHGAEQAIEAVLDGAGGLVVMVVQDVRGLVHPVVGPLDVRPVRGGLLQATPDQGLQPRERRRGPPFSATRSRLPATASSRVLSFRPEAASGGRPSSVMALRTAAQ
jgi:hypothetical protein